MLKNKDDLKTFKEASIDGNVTMQCLKDTMSIRVKKNSALIILNVKCDTCFSVRNESIVKHLVNTCYNVACNKLSIYLNRIEMINTVSLSMVKTNAVKNKVTCKLSNNNQQTNSGKWSVQKCKEFLSSFRAPVGGLLSALRERCVLILHLQKKNMENTWSYNIVKTRELCDKLNVTKSSNKLYMLTRMSKTIINPEQSLDQASLDMADDINEVDEDDPQ